MVYNLIDMERVKRKEIDMLNGPVMGRLILFCIPLILSSVLQLLFNAADVVVVGQFAGKQSLAAVGSTGSLINLITNLFIGFSVGVNVVIARAIGAGNPEKSSRAVHTSMLLALVSGVAVGLIGFFASKGMLELMNSPESIIDKATLYLEIYFLGSPASLVYNFGASVLRAKGDTRRPLYFLVIAGVLNALLNLFFVIVCNMDVAGVALATIISQLVSAVLVVICLMRETDYCKLKIRSLRFHGEEIKEIVKIGLPAGIYGTLFSISNVIIQAAVNGFGDDVVAGNSTATNIEGFVYVSMNAVYNAAITFTGQNHGAGRYDNAAITFTGQNHGAGRYDRIKIILRDCLILVTVIGLIFGMSFWGLGRYLARCYTSDQIVIDYSMVRMSIILPVYFLCGIMDTLMGMLRGMGYSTLPTINSFIGACMFRVIWVFTVFAANHTLEMLYISYPISWVLTGIAHFVMFIVVFKKCRRRDSIERKAVEDGVLESRDQTATSETGAEQDSPVTEAATLEAAEITEAGELNNTAE